MDRYTLNKFLLLVDIRFLKVEQPEFRHVTISLEMLLKVVRVFGSTIYSTVSSSTTIGVDLHAEERFDCSTPPTLSKISIPQLT